MIVIDASALVKVLVEKSPSAEAVRKRLRGETLSAPSLIDAEVLSVLRGLTLSGKLPEQRARTALSLLAGIPLQRAPLPAHLARVWQLRANYSAYDAFYVALAELLDCTLITSDARISRGTGANCPVEVFP
ncbi:type II toxin-antitoxin system VapC family toxin [Candidatus Protofrankia californiensis]|uniref:type II toxin-antitoxin system VapC family toxin n=1 Tax=Candidatus Protofrankia californiensis TaxID=1839754 RepID=UPI0010419579|nr:type II toxin-antitoxin system VapC family toxin [Candidatus Protofrankia californiensis]